MKGTEKIPSLEGLRACLSTDPMPSVVPAYLSVCKEDTRDTPATNIMSYANCHGEIRKLLKREREKKKENSKRMESFPKEKPPSCRLLEDHSR